METIDDDVLRELRYCAAGPGTRFLNGQVARAQDLALERGWLGPDKHRPQLVALTARGRAVLAAADPEQR